MEALVEKKKQPPRTDIWRMFDRIARRYDLLNRLLSFGQDIRWRKKVAQFLNNTDNQHVLDLATGTGDQLISLYKNSTRIERAVGTDLAVNMLEIGREKIKKQQLDNSITLKEGNVESINFADNTFDAVSISFGIRNVMNVSQSLSEMYRVLKSSGRVLILEFSIPKNRLVRKVYLLYFRYILPIVGSVISGDGYAYKYLNQTVETFPYGDNFCHLMVNAGFQKVFMYPMSFGIATIYVGEKDGSLK
jgi:demethylmenaquinone methyltransferase/2-methoxy-6-polyprenyl-1,4-benzoquinol methylase